MSTLSFLLFVGITMVTRGQQDVCPADGCKSDEVAFKAAASSSANDHFYIGGMFGMHSAGTDPYTCGNWRLRGMVNAEAFLWAVREYARIVETPTDPLYVGAFAMDTCTRASKAIEGVYSFETCRTQYSNIEPRNVIAYVGPDNSDQGIATAELLGEMNRTQVAHSATTAVLSDSERFPFFLRTAINTDVEMRILVEVLANKGIKYVQVMYNDNAFGMGLRDSFDKYNMATGMPTCVVKYMPINDETLVMMATSLNENSVSKYVLLLTDNVGARRVLERSDALGLQRQYVYVGINSWSNDPSVTAGLASAEKAITLSVDADSYYNKGDVDRFWTDFFNLKPDIGSNTGLNVNKHNPWFTQWWQSAFNCRIDLGTCDIANQNLRDLVDDSEVYVPFTLMAVEAIIRGVKDATSTYCGGQQVCSKLLNREDDIVYQSIRNARNARNEPFFDANGDVSSYFFKYKLNQIKDGVSQPLYDVFVDTNNNDQVKINKIVANNAMTLEIIPTGCKDSPCTQCGEVASTTQSTVVMTTEQMVSTTTQDPEKALALLIDRYFKDDQEFTGIWRDQFRDSEDSKTRFENGHDWIIALGVCAGLGIICVLVFEVYILYKLMGTNIGKQWRTMWLGQLLLFGIFLCYLTVIAYLWTPTKATCGITRFGVGVSYSICFAILLVKLMVLLTSKTSADTLIPNDVDSPNYLRGIYQFLMFIFVVGVQIVIAVMWLIMVPPDAVQVDGNNAEKVWICNHYTWSIAPGHGWDNMTSFVRTEFENHVISLTYIMFLIVLTTIIAMKAHGIITNHRESVFIGIAAGFSIPVWVAWGLIGGLNKDHAYAQEFGDGCIAFGLVITASVLLFSMFLPKVRQLVNMGVEGIYLEDDRDTYYGGSVIMAPPSYKSRPGSSVVYVNNNGFNEPVMLGDPNAVHLKHPGSTSTYSAPVYVKRPESTTGGSGKILRMTGDLTGKHPQNRKSASEAGYAYTGSAYGTYKKTRSESGGTLRRSADLGAL